jgi:lipopolysaccharide heptosyltransferase II
LKILILKPSSLGDVIQALPVLRLLKRRFPESRIYWWIETTLAPLLEADPDLAGVVLFHRRRWASPLNWGELWRSVQWMRAQQFDWVIDLQSLARSAAFAWLANGGLTIGLDDPREGARGFYDITVRRASFHTHAVEWYLSVLRQLSVPVQSDFEWIHPRPDIAAALRRKWPLEQNRWLAIQPGARWLTKRWPVEYFSQVVRDLAARRVFRFVLLGAPEDRSIAESIASAAPQRCLNLAGQTSLPEMVEWIRASELIITNDTGPMHVAAALGKPMVAIFGPTEPRRTGPYGHLEEALQLDLPCVPCLRSRCRNPKHLECLRELAPGTVLNAVERRLSQPRTPFIPAETSAVGRLTATSPGTTANFR